MIPAAAIKRKASTFMSDRRSPSLVSPLGEFAGPRVFSAISRSAQGILAIVALSLFLPLAGMGLQDRQALEQFHNRTLVRWPSGKLFRSDPARYFSGANAWFTDRAFPVVATTRFSRAALYSAFGDPPQPNVSISQHGFIFLAGGDAAHPYSFLINTCTSEADAGAKLQTAIEDIGRFARMQHTPIDVVLIPTISTLYGDRLPRSIPAGYREACAERAAGRSPLVDIESVEGTHYLYPRDVMRRYREDPAFFPIGGYHPNGLSVQVVRDAYLHALGIDAKVAETVELTRTPGEVMQYVGITTEIAYYQIENQDVQVDEAADDSLRSALAPFYSQPRSPHVYDNPDPTDPQSVLMISDSFGNHEGVSFAAAFRRVTQVWVPERGAAAFLQAVSGVVPFDRVVLLFNEGNVARVLEIAQALRSARSRAILR